MAPKRSSRSRGKPTDTPAKQRRTVGLPADRGQPYRYGRWVMVMDARGRRRMVDTAVAPP